MPHQPSPAPEISARLGRPLLVLAAVVSLAGCSTARPLPSVANRTITPGATSAGPPAGQLGQGGPGAQMGGGQAGTLQASYVEVVKKVSPQVVQIETADGLGSGIVFDAKGDIVTNAHVVGTATAFQVTYADGKMRPATLVGAFPPGDIAVVHVAGAPGVSPAVFADSSKLEVGDICMAIGNPLGLRSSVTNGIVSAVGRTVSEGNGFTLPDTIQTSAAINPGNSGGALVDLNGNVIGIPTLAAVEAAAIGGGTAAPGIGFAIPSNNVKDIASQLIASGRVTDSHRAYLGIRAATSAGTASGAVVSGVEPNGPAAGADIRVGDLITAINGVAVAGTDDLNHELAGLHPGAVATLTVLRSDGSTADIRVTLGVLPGQ